MFKSHQPRISKADAASAAERAMFAPPPFKFPDDADRDSGTSDTASKPVQAQLNPPLTPNFCTMPLHAPGRSVLPIQPKLAIGQPGDKYEQEADRMASQVMRMPDAPDGSEPIFQLMRSRSSVQAKGNGTEASQEIESQLSQSQGGGSPLSDEVRSFMEPRFGSSFENVRVHTDGNAVQMNRSLGAQAFTHGSDIYYGAGKSPANSDLTAHELTHVVQQTDGVQQVSADQPHVQQKCADCEKEESTLMRKEDSSIPSIQHKIGDGHDLQSPRFASDSALEACFDGEKDQFLRSGSSGIAVEKVQQALIDSGFSLPNFGVDGKFGSETGTAVTAFKQSSGIEPSDPVVGPKTMAEFDRLFPSSVPVPPSTDNPPDIENPPNTDEPPLTPPQELPLCPFNNQTDKDTSSLALTGVSLIAVPGVSCQIKSSQLTPKHLTIGQAVDRFKNKVGNEKLLNDGGQFYFAVELEQAIESRYKTHLASMDNPQSGISPEDHKKLSNNLDSLFDLSRNSPKKGQRSRRQEILLRTYLGKAGLNQQESLKKQSEMEALEPRELGTQLYNELWFEYHQKGIPPPLETINKKHSRMDKLQGIAIAEKEKCADTVKNVSDLFKEKGGFNVDQDKFPRRKENQINVGPLCKNIDRRESPHFDIVIYISLGSQITKLKKSLDDGFTVKAHVLSGATRVQGIPKGRKGCAKEKCIDACTGIGSEHHITIIGYDGDIFVFWDPSAGSSSAFQGGFGFLFFKKSENRLSTASSEGDLAVDSKGNHIDGGEHRYQVLDLGSI